MSLKIKKNDQIPNKEVFTIIEGKPTKKNIYEYLSKSKVIILGMPGAFTSTCSKRHLPSFIKNIDNLRERGVQKIACLSVNDPFVMDAWGKANNVEDKILMLADPFREFTKEIGAEVDKSDRGLGIRSCRYTMVVENFRVNYLAVEEQTSVCDISSAENIIIKI